MSEQIVDPTFLRESWEDAGHARDYVQAVTTVGLWESERLLMEKYVSREGAVLDIGCGAGRTTFGLYEAGYHTVTGFDLSATMIEAARRIASERGTSISFDIGDAASLPYAGASFDGALFSAQGLCEFPAGNVGSRLCARYVACFVQPATSFSRLMAGIHPTLLNSGVRKGTSGTAESRTTASSSSVTG